MLSKHERNELKENYFLRILETEAQYDVVTSFYPAQRVTRMLNVEDIMNIRNCDNREALQLLNEVRKNLGKDDTWHVRTFDFCDQLDVDEMFVQVFLASLKKEGPLRPGKNRKPAPKDPQEATNVPLRMIDDLKADLQKGIMESFETIQMRAKKWKIDNPLGEPMYKVANPNFRVIIRPYEVAHILEIHIQTARQMFIEARLAHSVPKQRFLSIKLFCNAHHIHEGDTRRALSIFHDDEVIYSDN